MLVLTRKFQEKIRIGDQITITVLRTKGNAVRIGIEAPSEIPVIRGELEFEAPHAGPDSPREAEPALEGRSIAGGAHGPARRQFATRALPGDRRPLPGGGTEPRISFQRMPRQQAVAMPVADADGAGPLRAMLPQRR